MNTELFPVLTDCLGGCGESTRVCSDPFLCGPCTKAAAKAMRGVPKTFDGGDIDNDGQWYGSEMCCLECRETADVRCGTTSTYLLGTLECGECGEVFAEYWL